MFNLSSVRAFRNLSGGNVYVNDSYNILKIKNMVQIYA